MTAIDRLLEWSEDIEQTPEKAEQELRDAGVDVEAFLELVHAKIARVEPSRAR